MASLRATLMMVIFQSNPKVYKWRMKRKKKNLSHPHISDDNDYNHVSVVADVWMVLVDHSYVMIHTLCKVCPLTFGKVH